jgi:hypothetical protein
MAPSRLALVALLASGHASALTIVFNDVGDTPMSAEALAGFQAGADLWEALLLDPVTVRIDIAMRDFGAGNENIIGQAGSYFAPDVAYADYRAAFAADAQSPADFATLATLPLGPTYQRLINQTNDTPEVDGDFYATWVHTEAEIYVNRANAKALGLLAGNAGGPDADIEFNTAFAFDFDRSDGINPFQMDFIGVAAHEIGHALGFISIVDYIDTVPGLATDFKHLPLDFLRYSAESEAQGLTDVGGGTVDKYLLIDGTSIAMSTGVNLGDGQQASHYKDNLGLGMMDPTASFGELRAITANDLLAFDAIGWNLIAVPEPSTLGLGLGLGALALAARRRRTRRHPR